MSNSLGEAVLDLTADDTQMTKDIEVAKGKVLAKLDDIAADMMHIGQNMTMSLSLPLLALGTFSVDAASDLEETKNKAQVVFQEMADSVIANAERADEALGLSERQYLEYASSIQAALTAGGMGIEEATALAENAVKTYADIASFHNAQTDDVAVAWQSAIRGQYEPIQKFFPFITDSYLKTYGIANGMVDENTETLTANQRALILNAIAMDEQLNPAINDFSETSDSAANQLKIMKGQAENAAATLGLQLLPYAIQFMKLLSDLIKRFQALSPEQQKFIVIIGAIVAAIGPLLIIVGSLVTAITAIAGLGSAILVPILLVVAAIVGLIAYVMLLRQAWENNFMGIQDRVKALGDIWQTYVMPVLQAVWAWLNGTFFPLFQALARFYTAVFNVALKVMAGIWQNVLLPALSAVVTAVGGRLMPVFTVLSNFFKNNLMPVIQTIAKWIAGTLVKAFESLTSMIQSVTNTLNTLASGLNNIDLPDWMTPGSPTPWEIGLKGVSRALKEVSRVNLPALSSNLSLMQAPIGVGGGGLSNQFNAPMTFVVRGEGETFDEMLRRMRK